MVLRLLTHFGYLAIASLLVAGGLAIPVPEELVQLSAGYLAHRGLLALVPAVVTCWLGIVAGDFLLFVLARRHGEGLLTRLRADRLLTPGRRATLDTHFDRHAFLTIVVARHLSGLRVPAYILAATHGVRPGTFLLADALSAGASVPLVVGAGWIFADRLEAVRHHLHQVHTLALGALLLLALGYMGWRAWRSRGAASP